VSSWNGECGLNFHTAVCGTGCPTASCSWPSRSACLLQCRPERTIRHVLSNSSHLTRTWNLRPTGRIGVYWDAIAPLHHGSRRERSSPFAVSSAERLPRLPNVPTVIESGVPDLNVFTWTGLFAPVNTPPDITEKLERALNKALQDNELQSLFQTNGHEVFPKSSVALTGLIRQDVRKWRALTAANGHQVGLTEVSATRMLCLKF
jgi:hypothetical protein